MARTNESAKEEFIGPKPLDPEFLRRLKESGQIQPGYDMETGLPLPSRRATYAQRMTASLRKMFRGE